MAITRTGIIILLLIGAALLTSWLKQSTPTAKPASNSTSQTVDFFLTDFLLRQYDSDGEVSYRMQGQRLEHYPEQDVSKISLPSIAYKTQQNIWKINARSALLKPESSDEIVLSGKVDIHRPGLNGEGSTRLQTEQLTLKPEAEIARAEQSVTITGQGSIINAKQMLANLKIGHITLHKVESRYDP